MNTEQKMLAAVLYGKEELRVEAVSIPHLGPSDVLVKVNVALTCGTDVKVFRRGYHARMIVPPAVLGHELAGDVVSVGSEVESFRVGQRVVAANSAPCASCIFARGARKIFARTCCSTTARMRSTSGSRGRSCGGTCTRSRGTSVTRTRR